MSCEHLVCAACAGPVAEGRCPACRSGRDRVHNSHETLPPGLMIAIMIAIVLSWLALLAYSTA